MASKHSQTAGINGRRESLPLLCAASLWVTGVYFAIWLAVGAVGMKRPLDVDPFDQFGPPSVIVVFGARIVPLVGITANFVILSVRWRLGYLFGWIAGIGKFLVIASSVLLLAADPTFQGDNLKFQRSIAWTSVALHVIMLAIYADALSRFKAWSDRQSMMRRESANS